MNESGDRKVQNKKPTKNRIKDAMIRYVQRSSERLWRTAFDECDSDEDGNINQRELLVLMKRLDMQAVSGPLWDSRFRCVSCRASVSLVCCCAGAI